MVELADTLDLGSSGKPCRFESCCPHQRKYHLSIKEILSAGGICFARKCLK